MAFTDSIIGFVGVSLVAPSAARSDSPVGFTAVTLTAPTAPSSGTDSLVGFTTVSMAVPHRPVLVLTPTGYKRASVRVFDGSAWR